MRRNRTNDTGIPVWAKTNGMPINHRYLGVEYMRYMLKCKLTNNTGSDDRIDEIEAICWQSCFGKDWVPFVMQNYVSLRSQHVEGSCRFRILVCKNSSSNMSVYERQIPLKLILFSPTLSKWEKWFFFLNFILSSLFNLYEK